MKLFKPLNLAILYFILFIINCFFNFREYLSYFIIKGFDLFVIGLLLCLVIFFLVKSKLEFTFSLEETNPKVFIVNYFTDDSKVITLTNVQNISFDNVDEHVEIILSDDTIKLIEIDRIISIKHV